MQVKKINSLNNNSGNNVNFNGERIPTRPIRKVSEETFKKVSAAITATGIASLMMDSKCNDYAKSIALNVERAKLSQEAEVALKEAFEISPPLADMLLATKDKYSSIRELSANSIYAAIDAYITDYDLTEKLIAEKDEDGTFKYNLYDIAKIVEINHIEPKLLELSLKQPTFVYNLLTKVDDNGVPSYSIDDIMSYSEAYNINPQLTNRLSRHLGNEGTSRFEGKNVLFIVKNNDEFMQYLVNKSNKGRVKNNPHFLFAKDEIEQIYRICDNDKKRNYAKNLIEKQFQIGWTEELSYLDNSYITFFLKSSPSEIAEFINRNFYNKNLITDILELRNGRISKKELEKMMSLKKSNTDKPALTYKDLAILTKNPDLAISIDCDRKGFSPKETQKVIELSRNSLDLAETLLRETHKVYRKESSSINLISDNFEYEKDDILTLLELAQTNPDVITKLVDMAEYETVSVKNNSTSKTVTSMIVEAANLYECCNKKRDELLNSRYNFRQSLSEFIENLKKNQLFTKNEIELIKLYREKNPELVTKILDEPQTVRINQKGRLSKKHFNLVPEQALNILKYGSDNPKLTIELIERAGNTIYEYRDSTKNLANDFTNDIFSCLCYAKDINPKVIEKILDKESENEDGVMEKVYNLKATLEIFKILFKFPELAKDIV